MKALSLPRLGPIARISFGLVALLVSLVLVADFVTGVVPSRSQIDRSTQQRIAENLALQLTGLLQAGEETLAASTLQALLARSKDIQSVSIRRNDGSTVLRRGVDDGATAGAPGQASTVNRLRVPILAGGRTWGEVEVHFADAAPATLLSGLRQPAVQAMLMLVLGGFALCYAYLRRAMQYLDPSASVPDRVRKGFDVLTEGVVIVDTQARIVLANQAFRRLGPEAEGKLNGRRIDTLGWLQAEAEPAAVAPWTRTLQNAETVDSAPYSVTRPDGKVARLLVTSAPIADQGARARGCMITFDDVTSVHLVNGELRHTLAELERSRVKIEAQNEELRALATRDSLTGCLNRRAFFEIAEALFDSARQQQTELVCVMADIDHFKQFNDLYGHGVGDQVIQVVARALGGGLRVGDTLCRYGGEEFCIVLPGVQLEVALAVVERLRANIEACAQGAIRGTSVRKVTSSFGVVTRALGARSLAELIEQADQALYQSKAAGRNRVTAFHREQAPA